MTHVPLKHGGHYAVSHFDATLLLQVGELVSGDQARVALTVYEAMQLCEALGTEITKQRDREAAARNSVKQGSIGDHNFQRE